MKMKNAIHFIYAWLGSIIYRHPSEDMLVIGITGTSGKSSTIHWLRQVLEAGGFTLGSLSTVDFYVAGRFQLNDQKMTMLGRMQIQKYLRKMADAGCQIAIVEMTSQGALQHRHRFINTDIMALTNLYPEHIEAHGGFEKYKKAKLRLFEYAAMSKRKIERLKNLKIGGQDGVVAKVAVVHGNNQYSEEFLNFPFDKKVRYGITETNIHTTEDGIQFAIGSYRFHPRIYGAYNASNLACVIAIAKAIGMEWGTLVAAVNNLRGAPGRVEFIPEAEQLGFRVIVDYAFEPVALKGLYDIVRMLEPKRVIHVLGAAGGGRDHARREPMGRLAGEKADIVIVTNEDPYDEDPMDIIHAVSSGAKAAGKKEGENLFEILDRGEAIQKAIRFAEPGDMVLVTGKGCEQRMCLAGGKMVPWDDRAMVRRHLKTLPPDHDSCLDK